MIGYPRIFLERFLPLLRDVSVIGLVKQKCFLTGSIVRAFWLVGFAWYLMIC